MVTVSGLKFYFAVSATVEERDRLWKRILSNWNEKKVQQQLQNGNLLRNPDLILTNQSLPLKEQAVSSSVKNNQLTL
jgi:hypothetical protein